MNEILLEHAELLTLLDAIHAQAMVSISPAHLFPTDSDERSALIKSGATSLTQRGLLQVGSDGKPLINDRLLAIATTVAFPKIAILVVSNDQQTGFKLCWFYQTGDFIVEHTFSEEKLHRITVLSGVNALINRMEDVLAIENIPPYDARIEMDQNAFFKVKNLAKRHELESAREILHSCGFTPNNMTALLNVLERPQAAGNIVFLRCASETVVDGRNMALLQDKQSTWSARQKVPGAETLIVETTDIPAIKKQMLAYFNELSK